MDEEFDSYSDFDMDNDYSSFVEENELDLVGKREADEDREDDFHDDDVFEEEDTWVDDQQDY